MKSKVLLLLFCCLMLCLSFAQATEYIFVMGIDDYSLINDCPYENDIRASDFSENIVDHLYYHTDRFAESETILGVNVDGSDMLELWRDWRLDESPIVWNEGYDHGDTALTGGTVVILGMHGNVVCIGCDDQLGGNERWYFRMLHRRDDVLIDSTDTLSSTYDRCRIWWRNNKTYSGRALIRMGASSQYDQTSIGDGRTRWVIMYACRSLQLEVDPSDDPNYTVQDIWGHDDINGGYRVILGASGKMEVDVADESDYFVDLQYNNNYTFKQAWFEAMDGHFVPYTRDDDQTPYIDESEPWDEGRCVIYGKGGAIATAQGARDNDDFKRFAVIPGYVPAATDYPDGWHSSWSHMSCE